MKFKLFFFFTWFLPSFLFCQTNRYTKLTSIKSRCDAILAAFTGKPETFDELIKEGTEGLKFTAPIDHEFRFSFYQSIGNGYYYKQNFKLAAFNFEQAYKEAAEAKLTEKSLKPLGNLVSIYHYLGLQNKADRAAQQLKEFVENIDTLKNKSDVYYNLGLYNQQQKFYYSIALDNFLKSVQLHKPIADTTKILKKKLDYGTKLMMVSEIYLQLKQPQKALDYLNEVKPFLNLSSIVDISAYGKFIRAYSQLNNKAAALKYYSLLHRSEAAKNGKWSELVSSNLEIAGLALKTRDFKTAKLYLDKAVKQSGIDNLEILTSSVNLSYGNYYSDLKKYEQAIKYYQMAEHGSKLYNQEQYADLLKSITSAHILLGNKKQASVYFTKYLTVSDSLNQRKISLNLAEMEARFQNKSKQQKIVVLDKENQIKARQLYEEKKTRWLLVGGALLLMVALFSIYSNYRNIKKTNLLLDNKNKELDILNEKLTEANQTKAKLFSIISHDLRNPISQLFTFLKIQQKQNAFFDEKEREKHQEMLLQSSSQLLESMEDVLLWSKSQMENFELEKELVKIEGIYEDVGNFIGHQALQKAIVLEIGKLDYKEFFTDYNLLHIVLRNILQNAVLNSPIGSKIFLDTYLKDGKPTISFTNMVSKPLVMGNANDIANGLKIKSSANGYGLTIIKDLAEKLDAEVKISTIDQNKYLIELLFQTG
ncbi:HAMP domain-containing histidine kinase [Pedobacter sp. SD-b]|uniref:histidine kinase n=1 Tax=Pedobacter segetis TaxID=2793069 RepID=A0ABS1BN40_9SPHI|nr:HAMP domain-containing sensor histidine kinase [Pedobacter segetis]MBK0384317.1 HAMP domain-containing histidine kinase [Pedobacter segetis]